MKSTDENILNRIKFFLIDSPNSTAIQIGAALNISRQKVCSVVVLDSSIAASSKAGSRWSTYSIDVMAPMPDKDDPLADAIAALMLPITATIRAQFQTDLAIITKIEIETAVLEAQKRIKNRLGESLQTEYLYNAIFGTKPPLAPAEPSRQETPASAVETKAPAAPLPPVGNFVPHDVVSKRTSHQTTGIAAYKAPQPGPSIPSAEKIKPPKITIVGLHDNKQELIKREFRDKFTLCLFNPDRLRAMQESINSGDDVICLANYISHKHTDVVTAAGANAIIVHGGMPALRDELIERFEARNAA